MDFLGIAIVTGVLGALFGGKRRRQIKTSPTPVEEVEIEEEKPKQTKQPRNRKYEVSAVRVTNNAISTRHGKSKSIVIEYSSLVDIPIIKNVKGDQALIVRAVGKSCSFIFSKCQLTPDEFDVIQRNAMRGISSSIRDFQSLAFKEYLRDSSIDNVGKKLEFIISNFQKSEKFWASKLKKSDLNRLRSWEEFFPIEKGKKKLREQYEKLALSNRQEFLDKIESNPLTKQQRLAVIRNNDLNLVLAAAGTGKTSVIVSKSLDLVESKQAESNDVLILAYNEAATEELQSRIVARGAAIKLPKKNCPKASTFHALGRKILREAGVQSHISVLATDEIERKMWVTRWLMNYIEEGSLTPKFFIELLHQPINPFDFESKQKYDAYVRDNEYRTLQGERV